MKKILVLILCVTIAQFSYGQGNNVGNTRFSFGLSFDAVDQFTPELDGFQSFKKPMDLGLRAYTWINVNSSLAVELGLGTTGIRTNDIEAPLKEKNLHFFNIDGGLVYKFNNGYILREDFPVAPFLFVKAKGSFMELTRSITGGQAWGVGLPVGGGVNWGVQEGIAIQTSVGYTFGLTDNYDNNLIWSVGALFDLGDTKKKEIIIEPEPEEPVVLDTDGDGIIDENDDCVDLPGLAKFNGCPDSDADGIADAEDNCPDVAGLARFNGCPDTDGDGIVDAEDECPTVAGIAALKGCPNPDADGDGIADADDKCPKIPGVAALGGCPDADGDGVTDSEDRCPTEVGPLSNKGCPEMKQEVIEKLEFAAKNIQFETGSAVIKTSSFKVLDEVVGILKEYTNYSVSVGGHTDNVGNDASNLVLSEKRAQAAASYLISKGIDPARVSSAGYGETQPVGDNTTAAGRALNRRVVFNLFIK
ncbi:MAG: OmpA family protein [Chitinophagales bacterium]